MRIWALSLVIIVVFRLFGTVDVLIPFTVETFHLEEKTISVTQFAVPLAVIYFVCVFYIFKTNKKRRIKAIMKKPVWRFVSFAVTTAVFAVSGYLVYFFTKSGLILEATNRAFWLGTSLLVVPFILSIAASNIYDAMFETSTDYYEVWKIALISIIVSIILNTEDAKAICARNNVEARTGLKVLSLAIPLAIIYLCTIPFIIKENPIPMFEEELIAPPDPPKTETVIRVVHTSNGIVSVTVDDKADNDANSKGLPTGLAD